MTVNLCARGHRTSQDQRVVRGASREVSGERRGDRDAMFYIFAPQTSGLSGEVVYLRPLVEWFVGQVWVKSPSKQLDCRDRHVVVKGMFINLPVKTTYREHHDTSLAPRDKQLAVPGYLTCPRDKWMEPPGYLTWQGKLSNMPPLILIIPSIDTRLAAQLSDFDLPSP